MSPRNRRRQTSRSKTLLAAVATILFAVGLYVGFELAKPPPRPDFGLDPPPPVLDTEPPDLESSAPEPEPEPSAPLQLERQPPPGANGAAPRISIVIDDLGRGLKDLDVLAGLGVPLTYSVLPFESHTPQVVAELRRRGVEYLCHLPMQAKGDADPGPGALVLAMNPDQLQDATRRALSAVPGAVGVNNHMGSGMLPQQEVMTSVLEVLAQQGLYFLDSRTSPDTVGYSLARHLGLKAGERQVFLDTERDLAFIRGQFDELLAAARQRGGAIAIAHPYRETLEILAAAIPEAREQGFEFVTASSLPEG